jgi:GTP cyclohydrolase I
MTAPPSDLTQGRPLSLVIKERIQSSKKRFHANDNIAEFIRPGELDLLLDEVEQKMKGVLQSLVIDTERSSRGVTPRLLPSQNFPMPSI